MVMFYASLINKACVCLPEIGTNQYVVTWGSGGRTQRLVVGSSSF